MNIKKIIALLILITCISISVYNNINKKTKNDKININIELEEQKVNISEYYVYGTKLNINGTINNIAYNDIKLVLYNEKEIYETEIICEQKDNIINLRISNNINNGLYLDNIEIGSYLLLLKVKDNNIIKYYPIENNTTYKNLTYYTISNYNKKIIINTNKEYNTMALEVSENKDKEIYDITIDAGHGGKDSGAVGSGYQEKNITLDMALLLKEKLLAHNLKVAITRDKDVNLEEYNIKDNIGRAVIPQHNNSKYLFSIHLNSHSKKSMHGLEILTPSNIDYTFAKRLANYIVEKANTTYSNNLGFKMYNGVYTRIVSQSEIDSRNKDNNNPYDIKVGASYYYMIREPGATITGAYVDGRDDKTGINPYYNSNKGVESYIIELGYIINKNDVNNIINNKDKYIDAIVSAILEELKI